MGNDLTSYRIRIHVGLFGPGRGFKGHGFSKYTSYSSKRDIYVIALLAIIIIINSSAVGKLMIDTIDAFTPTQNLDNLLIKSCSLPDATEFSANCLHKVTMTSNISYSSYFVRILLLSMDVETNPGPLDTADKNEILDAIKASGDGLKLEMQYIKHDIENIKDDMKSVWNMCKEMNTRVDNIHKKQNQIETHLSSIESEVDNIKMDKEMLQLDVDAVHQNCNENTDRISNIEMTVERIERKAIRANLRIFNLPDGEEDNSDENRLKQKVVDSVLKVSCPNVEWSPDCLSDTYRLGKPGDFNRTVITTFKDVNQKFKVFEGRNKLTEKGIKIANELTTREKKSLYDLKQNGKTGYFYKGKLHINSNAHEENNRGSRVFVSAHRKLQQAPDSIDYVGSPPIVGGYETFKINSPRSIDRNNISDL